MNFTGFLQHLVSWSRSRPYSFWGVMVQWVGFSIYFSFVNIYLASLFLAVFFGYFSATLINVYVDYARQNAEKIPSR